jgi:hypothetical protein
MQAERKRDEPMKTLPIVPKKPIDQGEMFSCSDLPLYYIYDYSKIGLQVSSYQEALNVLRGNHYRITENMFPGRGGPIHKTDDIPAVVRLLSDNGIESQMTDMVTTIYQG